MSPFTNRMGFLADNKYTVRLDMRIKTADNEKLSWKYSVARNLWSVTVSVVLNSRFMILEVENTSFGWDACTIPLLR